MNAAVNVCNVNLSPCFSSSLHRLHIKPTRQNLRTLKILIPTSPWSYQPGGGGGGEGGGGRGGGGGGGWLAFY